ncbi:helix-turn-helix domain-containing protein [Lentilactobacillus parafarraginis]|uniref:helix-turn-helix domain-containing protein n=1 Tax=Lentilactobacillus parafarraginis TaxID=390842 RepID=UPI001CDAABE9|nr:helix-turn-helix domain-containing protein [Lentilactobacillus parafarraginis]
MSQQVSLKLFLDNHIFDGMTDKQIKIMVAAIRIFAEKGYANTSTKEIAKCRRC